MEPSPISRQDISGVVLLCDETGKIVRICHDGLNMASRLAPGQAFENVVAGAEVVKAGHFLNTLREQGVACDWEMNAECNGTLTPLCFAGCRESSRLLVLAALNRVSLLQLQEHLLSINNEQANVLRSLAGELARRNRERVERDSHYYDELSRLNNELAALQREMARKNVELEKLNALKNEFLGMAAHDLRSPLGVILSYSEFLEADLMEVLSREQREFLTTIKSTSEFLLEVVNHLLDVSAIESGRLELDLQPADLATVIQRNVALNRVLAEKKHIFLDFHSQAELPPMLLDAGKVEQVLNNLLSNAIKFSHPQTRIEVRLLEQNAHAVVAVQDHGQGIPTAELGKLFQPFQKTTVRSTGGEKSTGLGLAIVRRIITAHGGKVWVESAVGSGSTFAFSLPLEASAVMSSCAARILSTVFTLRSSS